MRSLRRRSNKLENLGETSPQPLPKREIDGEPALRNTVEVRGPEVQCTVVQYFTIHDDAVHTVTLGAHETALSDVLVRPARGGPRPCAPRSTRIRTGADRQRKEP
jgi:hypothetical protein